MIESIKFFETGSYPYYLNLNGTAKDFSINESTNPENGLLDILSKFVLIQDYTEIKEPKNY